MQLDDRNTLVSKLSFYHAQVESYSRKCYSKINWSFMTPKFWWPGMRSHANLGRLRLRKTIPAPAPSKMFQRLRGCEVVQIWDGSGSISKKLSRLRLRQQTKCSSGSGSRQNVPAPAAPAPQCCCWTEVRPGWAAASITKMCRVSYPSIRYYL